MHTAFLCSISAVGLPTEVPLTNPPGRGTLPGKTMNSARTLLLAGSLALLFSGCNSATAPKLAVQQKPNVDLAAYRTFAILPLTEHVPGTDPVKIKAAAPIVTTVIRNELVKKGYQEASVEEANFTIVLNAAAIPRTRAVELGYVPSYVGSGWYDSYEEFRLAADVRIENFDEAVLALQIYDAKTKELVWVGYGTAMKKENASIEERVQRVGGALVQLLGAFPKAAATAAAPAAK
jgi:Domain of unknown function (DUF4136)